MTCGDSPVTLSDVPSLSVTSVMTFACIELAPVFRAAYQKPLGRVYGLGEVEARRAVPTDVGSAVRRVHLNAERCLFRIVGSE